MKRNSLSKFITLSLSASIIFANTITARADETTRTFKDLNPDRWSAPYIESLYKKGYISGYPDGTFKPKEFITRAEVSAIFAKMGIDETKDGLEFIDVSPNEWYYDEINTITKIGLATGYPDGSFKPNNLLTRNEAFKVAATTLRNTDVSSINPDFVDQGTVAEWAEIYEKHLMHYDVLGGFPDNTVKGDATITREEFIKLLYRIINDENISETISESVASWDSYYEQLNKDGQTTEVIPPVVTPVVTPKPSEKPSTSGGGGSSDSSDDSSNTVKIISRTPLINSILSGDKTVSGTGISGSIITVTMPNSKTYTATVGSDKKWSVSITETLAKNDVVKATQTESGKIISAIVSTTVSDKPISSKPVINDITEGDKAISGTGIAGAEITVTMPNNNTYTTIVGPDNKWSITITENLLKDDVITAIQTENDKSMGELVSTNVKELILLDVTRASLKEGDPLGPNTFNTKTSSYDYGTDNPVSADEIIISLNDNYLDSTVVYYKLTTADTANYTIANLPSVPSESLSLTAGEGKITDLSNGDKYVIVSTGTHNGTQKSVLSTIVINNIRDGSRELPFAVYNIDTLLDIPDSTTLFYDQVSNIDLSETTWDTSAAKIFKGSYYGNNNKITGFHGETGLFGTAENATIDGINLEISEEGITATESIFGVISRTATSSNFSNITVAVNGDINAVAPYGTIVGNFINNSSAENIKITINSDINVTGINTGGFAGQMQQSTVDNIEVTLNGYVNAQGTRLGGVVGLLQNSTASNAKININGTLYSSKGTNGGLAGVMPSGSAYDVEVILNGSILSGDGSPYSGSTTGGLAGQIVFAGKNPVIENITVTIADGAIIESKDAYAGGVLGITDYVKGTNIIVNNNGTIKALNNAGGAFGKSATNGCDYDGITVINSKNSSISADADYAGGAFGYASFATLSNIIVENYGEIKGSRKVAGMFGALDGEVVDSYSYKSSSNTIEATTGLEVGNYYGYKNSLTSLNPEISDEENTINP